jgi:transcription antitermination factor NusG
MANPGLQKIEARVVSGSSDKKDAVLVHSDQNWFAIFTVPRSEQAVARHFEVRQIESFLPTCTKLRVWKNRQRVKVVEPLFPAYIFARIGRRERSLVLGSPGVLRIVGNSKGPLPIDGAEIEFL